MSLIVLSVSAATDLKDRIIPNELVVTVAALGLLQSLAFAPELILRSTLAALLVFFVLAPFAYNKIIGGGDLKLISATTLLVPPTHVGMLLLQIALVGGALSCLYIAARYLLQNLHRVDVAAEVATSPAANFATVVEKERGRILAGGPLPYAVAVLGGVIVYIATGVSIVLWQCSAC